MKRALAILLTAALLCLCIAPALAATATKKDDGGWNIENMTVYPEVFDSFLNWEDVAKDDVTLARFAALYGGMPDAVFSGFHMMKRTPYTPAEEEAIREEGRRLLRADTVFYTGHCTGLPAFEILRGVLGDRLRYVHCGEEITL